MTIEECKAQPFKFDGDCNPVPISAIWNSIPRKARMVISTLVHKGKNPDIMKFI